MARAAITVHGEMVRQMPHAQKKEPTPEELERLARKLEAARDLGLLEKVRRTGWGGLSAAETGRVGALISRRLRQGSA